MSTRFVYWQDGEHFIGYLEEFPDYWTQGESMEDLKLHLADLQKELSSVSIPCVRRMGELTVEWSDEFSPHLKSDIVFQMKSIAYCVYREDEFYVAQCLNVDVCSFGDTRNDAVRNLTEAVELYFEEPAWIKTLEALLGFFAALGLFLRYQGLPFSYARSGRTPPPAFEQSFEDFRRTNAVGSGFQTGESDGEGRVWYMTMGDLEFAPLLFSLAFPTGLMGFCVYVRRKGLY